MDLNNWPFKGKRSTNAYLQTAGAFVGGTLATAVVLAWPLVALWVLALCASVALVLLGRKIWRDIRAEWRA